MSNEIELKIKESSANGYRVLLLAYSKNHLSEKGDLPEELESIALILIEDTIRKDAIETIKWFKENDVQIKIISGDNPQTVSFIAERVGVKNAKEFINLEGMSLEEVSKIADKYTVFGRVSPEQKHALIKALKKKNVVAMTGDGVNDTLALKEADCSIAMADGSEVARNISNLVLLNSNFSSLPSVVEEGRRVINNVQSSSTLFLMKTIMTILLTVFVLAIGVNYPFRPTQMFLMEFFVIGVPSFFLALLPNKELIRGNFIPYVLKKGLPYGLILLINIAIALTLGKLNLLTVQEVATLSTIMLTAAGFLNLLSLCFPYNIYKYLIVTFSFIGITIAGYFLSDFFGMIAITEIVWKLALTLGLLTANALLIMKNINLFNSPIRKLLRLKDRLYKLTINTNIEKSEMKKRILKTKSKIAKFEKGNKT
jgi:cation-transporting ATPase E